jgi:hypothetical protein
MNRFLLAACIAIAITACGRTSYPADPNPPTDRRYPDPYPSGDNNRSYPAEGQKDGVVTIIRTGNGDYDNLPPGQAKKKYGSQSARVYAPGQRKKNGGYNRIATVIAVPDFYASRATSGQLYYNYRGNSYWKQNDGYYHLSGNDGYNNNWKNKGRHNK